jgi:hypothetical protein
MNNSLENSIFKLRVEFLLARLVLDKIYISKNTAIELVDQNNDCDAYRKALELEENSFSLWMKTKWSRIVNFIPR